MPLKYKNKHLIAAFLVFSLMGNVAAVSATNAASAQAKAAAQTGRQTEASYPKTNGTQGSFDYKEAVDVSESLQYISMYRLVQANSGTGLSGVIAVSSGLLGAICFYQSFNGLVDGLSHCSIISYIHNQDGMK